MIFRQWHINKVDKIKINSIANECDIDPFVALLAVCRGIDEPYDIEEMLSNDIYITDPLSMADMEKAAIVVNESINNDKLIAIYGDYDCDGVTATAMLYDHLRQRGARVIYYIPNREEEGYGMSADAVQRLYNQGVQTIITVDNGINAYDEIELATSLGMTVVVTDHHLPTQQLPNAAAVVDCHRNDCASEYKDICGAFVAYKLICAIEDKAPEELLYKYADLVAIATIGDIMPLTNENRAVVKAGLDVMRHSSRCGIEALLEVSGLKGKPLSAGAVSFGIVPRINAAGRMGSADIAVSLLLQNDYEAALELAKEINSTNIERQNVEQEITKSAIEIIEARSLMHDRVIVVEGKGWHHGVVGIVAARLCEKYGRPSIVLSCDGDKAIGSARGIEGFSIFDCIASASDILTKFGGHKLAAGLTLDVKNIDELRQRLNEWAKTTPLALPTVNVDCLLNVAAISIEMAEIVSLFEPFGAGNRMPLFGIVGLRLDRITPVGNGKHLRLLFSKQSSVLQAMMFSVPQSEFGFAVGDIVDIAFTMAAGEYNGAKQLNLVVKYIRLNGIDDSNLPKQISLYDSFVCGEYKNYCDITPTRDDVATVFRAYAANGSDTYVINHLMAQMPVGKILICKDILLQMGVIAQKENQIKRVEGVHSDLNNSEYYVKLTSGGDKQ